MNWIKSIFMVSILLVPISGMTAGNENIATFSIVARDPVTDEIGVGVASRFFAVGSVVPWAKAGVGGVATQAFANTSYGPRGLDMLEKGLQPEEVLKFLLRNDGSPNRRQVGIISADGTSVTYTGKDCLHWAGGRNGLNYAIQGNILTGENVVAGMEKTFLETRGTLADRIYAALVTADREGGDARGKQSAAMIIVKDKAGYGGFNDRAIDIRVDDHPEPFKELGRLLDYAQMNYLWNQAWTLFEGKKYDESLPIMENAARKAPANAEVLYDLAVIRLSAKRKAEALDALRKAVTLSPKLKKQAMVDKDLRDLKDDPDFRKIIEEK